MLSQKIGLVIVLFVIPLALLAYLGLKEGGRDFFPARGGGPQFSRMEISGIPLSVEVVKTPATREQGLSGRASLAENEGMLFLFEKPGLYGIWMKDMLFPIDILWLNEAGVIVHIQRAAVPESYPTVFYPKSPASYVLELLANFTELHNVKVGDTVTLPRGI